MDLLPKSTISGPVADLPSSNVAGVILPWLRGKRLRQEIRKTIESGLFKFPLRFKPDKSCDMKSTHSFGEKADGHTLSFGIHGYDCSQMGRGCHMWEKSKLGVELDFFLNDDEEIVEESEQDMRRLTR